ncbi:MAG: ABC transporter permease subunit, partial [Clostridia bacterium]|nr:ABC transporter permease subunit [Clostridia bacterium]
MNTILLCSIIDDFKKVFIENDRWLTYLEGMANTIVMSLLAICIGIVIGLLVSIVRNINLNTGKLKFIDKICGIYAALIRGIPMMLQLYIMYFVILTFDAP